MAYTVTIIIIITTTRIWILRIFTISVCCSEFSKAEAGEVCVPAVFGLKAHRSFDRTFMALFEQVVAAVVKSVLDEDQVMSDGWVVVVFFDQQGPAGF